MTDKRDPATRATRLAANAGLLAVLAWAVLFYVTTQIANMRAASPFADDPWDVVASYAAIFLPIVVGATAVRSVRHRGPHLEPATARRIRSGVAIALLTIGANVVSDAVALMVVGTPASDARHGLMIGLVVTTAVLALVAGILLVRAMGIGARTVGDPAEPDVLDDLLGLARDAARAVRPIKRPTERLVGSLEHFLATSPASPRRHRFTFGILVAGVFGVAFALWRNVVEGPAASLAIFGLFVTLAGGGLFAIYLITLVPLRLVRRAD